MTAPLKAWILYTNWRGKTSWRFILPTRVEFCSTSWHREPQWILHALDVNKGVERSFALIHVHEWRNETGKPEEDWFVGSRKTAKTKRKAYLTAMAVLRKERDWFVTRFGTRAQVEADDAIGYGAEGDLMLRNVAVEGAIMESFGADPAGLDAAKAQLNEAFQNLQKEQYAAIIGVDSSRFKIAGLQAFEDMSRILRQCADRIDAMKLTMAATADGGKGSN